MKNFPAPTADTKAILLRYHEIALKGNNRGWFEQRLAINARKLIQRAIGKDLAVEPLCLHGRVLIQSDWSQPAIQAACDALRQLFGLSSFSVMRPVPTNLDTITDAAVEEFQKYLSSHPMPRTFRVFTRRSDKALSLSSMDIDRHVGGTIHDRFPGLKVDLDQPEFTLGIELRHRYTYLWSEKIPGPGGLPVGTSGHFLSLLSGGLDSPVAAIQVLKRGGTTGFLHFHGTPFVGAEVLEKVKDLARIVNRFQPDPRPLHVVPFGKMQEQIALATNPKLRTILYRRMMVRIACALAREHHAKAIVSGESLGQVASQTIENISTIDDAADLLVLRPLVTMDKDEIIAFAHRWDTFTTAIRPGADCCTLFADRHPTIRAHVGLIEEQESRFPVQDLVNQAVSSVEIHRV